MKHFTRLPIETTSDLLLLLEKYQDAWNRKALDLMMSCLTDDAEFTDIMGQIAIGSQAISDQHRFIFDRMMKIAVLSLEDLYLRSIGEGLIMVTGKWSTEGHTSPAGEPLPKRNGVMHFICRYEQGNWKISLVFNTDLSRLYTNIEDYQLKYYK